MKTDELRKAAAEIMMKNTNTAAAMLPMYVDQLQEQALRLTGDNPYAALMVLTSTAAHSFGAFMVALHTEGRNDETIAKHVSAWLHKLRTEAEQIGYDTNCRTTACIEKEEENKT
jgi:hypothetical protein